MATMTRLGFLRRSAGVAVAVAGLEKWHQAFDAVLDATGDASEAVVVADRVGVNLSTADQILRDLYLPAMREHLNNHLELLQNV